MKPKKQKKLINVEIGQRVKKYREAAGMTQEVFSELVDLGDKHISAIECGSVGLSLSSLKQICTVLSIPADALLFEQSCEAGQEEYKEEIHFLTSRLSRLPPNKFKIVKNILNQLLAVLAFPDTDIEVESADGNI